ncbi:MAG: tetratricopeptide repeat protein [Syntrophobacteraceae bacterium]|nr:tetratricopeptide repeat protein [Syntrophobacteraceae bacterium]
MPPGGAQKTWGPLIGILEGALEKLRSRSVDGSGSLLVELGHQSSEAGFMALSRLAERLTGCLEGCARPGWDGQGAASLDHAMGALLEKMRRESPGPDFDASLNEILSFPLVSQSSHDEGSTAGYASPMREPLSETARDYVMDRLDWYREVLREDPSSAFFAELAEELCAEGRWQEAVQTLRDGLRYHPGHMRGHALLGWALWEYGAAEQAERALELVRTELVRCAVVYRVLGEIRTHHGDLEEAGRLKTIHDLMRMGMDDRVAGEGAVPVAPPQEAIKPGDEPTAAGLGDSRVMGFLMAMMDRVGIGAPMKPRPVKVFTAEDRKALEKWIHAHAGGL